MDIRIVLIILVGLVLGWITTTGVKSQWVRLLDIFIIGPFWIWAGMDMKRHHKAMWTWILAIHLGAATIAYNLKNYMVVWSTAK